MTMTSNSNPLGALLPRSAAQVETPAAARALTQEEAAILGDGLHELFCAQARALTMGQSSSLPQETAAELTASILYTLGVQKDRPESYACLLGASLPERLVQGRRALVQKTEQAKALAAQLCLTAPELGCIALHDTLSGILRGLEHYDARFFAHRVPGDIDYQLLIPVPETTLGIDYILAYLTELHCELCFLARFPRHRVLALLDGMSTRWRELVCNLCAPVANNALGLAMLDANPLRLHISDGQRKGLAELLSPMTEGMVESRLLVCSDRLTVGLSAGDTSIVRLLRAQAHDFAPGLYAAAQTGDLSHVFFSFGLPHGMRSTQKSGQANHADR